MSSGIDQIVDAKKPKLATDTLNAMPAEWKPLPNGRVENGRAQARSEERGAARHAVVDACSGNRQGGGH